MGGIISFRQRRRKKRDDIINIPDLPSSTSQTPSECGRGEVQMTEEEGGMCVGFKIVFRWRNTFKSGIARGSALVWTK